MSAGAVEPAQAETGGRESGGALQGQTLVVLGGSAGIGFETARLARAQGAEVILTARNPDPLERAARALSARDAKAFDAGDPAALRAFFTGLDGQVDHVLLTAGRPEYGHVSDLGAEHVLRALGGHQLLALEVAELAPSAVRRGGSLVLIGGTGGRR